MLCSVLKILVSFCAILNSSHFVKFLNLYLLKAFNHFPKHHLVDQSLANPVLLIFQSIPFLLYCLNMSDETTTRFLLTVFKHADFKFDWRGVARELDINTANLAYDDSISLFFIALRPINGAIS